MKAITCKYMPATNTKPSRWKVSASGVKSAIYPMDYAEDDHGIFNAFIEYQLLNQWQQYSIKIGTLPNGDHVAVMYCD